MAQKPTRPVQQVIPEPAVPLQPPGGAPHPLRLRSKSQKRRVSHLQSLNMIIVFFRYNIMNQRIKGYGMIFGI